MKQEVEKLRRELENLEIKQESLSKEIQEIKTRWERLLTTEQVERKEIVKGSGLYHRDKVRVVNPSKGRDNEGTICGSTKDNLVKLKPTKGNIIRRLPKNLRRIQD